MKVIAGRVVDQQFGFQLTAEEEKELIVALDDIRSGKFEDGHELLRELQGLTKR